MVKIIIIKLIKVAGLIHCSNATDISASVSHPTCSDIAGERRDMKRDEDTAYEEMPRYICNTVEGLYNHHDVLI